MAKLCAKYRPRKWSDVVGQEVAVSAIRESLRQGWGGRAWSIVGESGTGCTTIAMLLAEEQADEARVSYTAGVLVDTAMVVRMANENPGKERIVVNRAYVIDRPSGIPADALEMLLSVLPCLHKNICVVFTQTFGDERAWLSESVLAQQVSNLCHRVVLTKDGLEEPFAKRCKEIADQEGLGGKNLPSYKALARRCGSSIGAMLNQIEMGEMMKDCP